MEATQQMQQVQQVQQFTFSNNSTAVNPLSMVQMLPAENRLRSQPQGILLQPTTTGFVIPAGAMPTLATNSAFAGNFFVPANYATNAANAGGFLVAGPTPSAQDPADATSTGLYPLTMSNIAMHNGVDPDNGLSVQIPYQIHSLPAYG